MSDIADIIAQETQDGRLIVRFLISTMHGDIPDSQPCHRLDAARLLVKLGFEPAQSLIEHVAPRRSSGPRPQSDHEAPDPARDVRSALAQIVRDETNLGRTAVRFLVDVMQGQLPDFKPCHRLSAARELLRLGFNHDPEDQDRPVHEAAPAEPEPDPAEVEAQRRLAEDIEFSLHGPVYYATYPYPCGCEDRRHDCKGNPLSGPELDKAARRAPGRRYFISEPPAIDAFVARYADYLTRHNAENPHIPIDFNLILPNLNLQHHPSPEPARHAGESGHPFPRGP